MSTYIDLLVYYGIALLITVLESKVTFTMQPIVSAN